MKPWNKEHQKENLVNAIEEGKIVQVTKGYALQEGLPILNNILDENQQEKKNIQNSIKFKDINNSIIKTQVTKELIENFHWYISKKRRQLGLTRSQLSLSLNETEDTIKLIENGIVQQNDFILINKIQDKLQLNLRNDKKDFKESPRNLISKEKESHLPDKIFEKNNIHGDEIEIIEDK
jgi:ribosome-binding protein aMBF1 (putative translation factor)